MLKNKCCKTILCLLVIFFLLDARAGEASKANYDGPLFDSMSQWCNDNLDLQKLIKAALEAKVTKLALFSRRPETGHEDDKIVNREIALHPDFLVIGTPKLLHREVNTDKNRARKLADIIADKRFHFVSEIMIRHYDKTVGNQTLHGVNKLDSSWAELKPVFAAAAVRHIPVLIHWELLKWADDKPEIDRFLTSHSDQVIIFPHLGFGSPEQIQYLIEKHQNIYFTISKRADHFIRFEQEDSEGATGPLLVSAEGKILPAWKDLLTRFPDRFLFATDLHRDHLWIPYYATIVRKYREILGQLPPEIAKKIAYDNAIHLYGL